MDAVEILTPECLLDVFLSLLSRTSDHLTELLVSLALLCLFRLIEESGSAYLDAEGLLLLVLFNDLRVTRESIFDILKDVL